MRLGVSVLLPLALSPAAIGICVIDPAQYIDRPATAVVGRLGGGTCVPIGARYALTANHVGVGANSRIRIGDKSYPVAATYPHPNAPGTDLKVVEIDGPPYFDEWAHVHPDPLSVPVGSIVYIGGTGHGYGKPMGTCAEWGDRAEHWAMNEIEGFLAGAYVWYRFDEEVPHEGIATSFDSGSFLGYDDPETCRITLLGIATSATTTGGPTCDGNSAYYALVDPDWLAPYTGALCEGDLDGDGDTDIADFMLLASSYSATSCSMRAQGDLNADGRVDILDFAILSGAFGCSSDAMHTVVTDPAGGGGGEAAPPTPAPSPTTEPEHAHGLLQPR